MQIDGIKEYVDKRGWSIEKQVCEIGSGKDDKRPKRDELLKSAKRREIDVIVVWKLDRWGRSLVDLVNTLQELDVAQNF